ncbi:PhzF family phenazine biosynthesis protein [Ornithinimicrobium sp. W1665]|uniref:PhzF family phenazine biosynthesis protein n=1 Tax=Ornithinimicrobium sp. W1665 TaxID=3416666 RepID=UPI003CFA066F
MTIPVDVHRYAAFSDRPRGGNPAGVVLEASHLTAEQMQHVAAEVGYSETAFVTGPLEAGPGGQIPIRYFAPEREVDFCGHATIATAVAIGRRVRPGTYTLATKAGPVAISAWLEEDRVIGTFRSPDLGCYPLPEELLTQLLRALGWSTDDLDQNLPPAIGYGGNHHPVLVTPSLQRLATLSYDFDALQRLCRAHDWVTVHLVTPTGPDTWQARDPFPWGGVVEDPATGSAAAAFAGYLRAHDRVAPGQGLVITQGVEMGRPSRIQVELLDQAALISGVATPIHDPRPTRRETPRRRL